MSDVTSQNSNKTASGGASGGTPPSNANADINATPSQGVAVPAATTTPSKTVASVSAASTGGKTLENGAQLQVAQNPAANSTTDSLKTAPQLQVAENQKSNVAFHSANITPKKDVFAEQNQKNAEKKAKDEANRKKILKITYIVGGVILAILLAWLIIWLIMRATYNADITNPDRDEQGQAIGVTEADKILESSDGDMNKVQEYFDDQITKEKNAEKKNAVVVMSMQYYAESGEWERAIETSKQADLEKMTQWQLANYTMIMTNSYVSLEKLDDAEYWQNYYYEVYPEMKNIDEGIDENGEPVDEEVAEEVEE